MDSSTVKVYTVNGPAAGSSSSLPDWLTRKRAAKSKGRRAVREHIESTIELIQGFEFPEASIKVKTTRDGHHAVATGTYKPQIKVWDLDQLSQKFERHSESENVDFILLSDDWTKSIHLQNDRTVELHTQGGFHYRTRIPKFGRSLAYHLPSCDTYLSASGNEIYRLNLDLGRFMNPLVLAGDDILGVNVVDINPAHHLLAFGIDGNGSVQFWDPRSRSEVGILRVPRGRLVSPQDITSVLGVTAISSRSDGLSYAIGTSTGHTLLYDIRAARPFAVKDQGYGLPVRTVSWIEGGSRMAGDGMVLSADKKVIKIWEKNDASANFASITPASDLNHVHHIPGSGVLVTANESIQMGTYYIPQLGPAPKWASFLENITEEMEDQSTRSVYEDFKFVERNDLKSLGLDHLVGTPALKPYLHGYFISLKLYDTARLIANPFAYAEHREKLVREKMDKMAETRIRAKKEPGVKVNKGLAEKILRDEERARKREERKKARKEKKAQAGAEAESSGSEREMDVDQAGGEERTTLLNDPRFTQLFEDPEFQVDEESREFALLNPSTVARKKNGYAKTAVEEEEDESDKSSSDGLGNSDSDNDSDGAESHGSDSSDANEMAPAPSGQYGQRHQRQRRVANVKMVPMQARASTASRGVDKNATFGQRRSGPGTSRKTQHRAQGQDDAGGPMEMSWVPSSTAKIGDDDALVPGSKPFKHGQRRKGVESFGAGLEKGGEEEHERQGGESERKGRVQRRKGVRSGSKNAFRRL
ncbi:WD repeat NOL10/ENP2 family protein [Pleurotus pulmonarius]